MKITFRKKFIFGNLLIVAISIVIIATLVIQGMLYFYINNAQELLLNMSKDANLFMQQEMKAIQSPGSVSAIYINNSIYFADTLAKSNKTRIQLYDLEGNLIADSARIGEIDDDSLRQEIEIALNQQKNVSVYKKINDISYMYLASPVILDNEKVGVISFLYSLSTMDTIINKTISLFYIAAFFGAIILYLMSRYLTKSLLKPIDELITFSKDIIKGNYNSSIIYELDDEIGKLTRSFNQMGINIHEKIDEIEDERQKLTSIISSIEDGVIAVNWNKDLLSINKKAKEIFNIEDNINSEILKKLPFCSEIIESIILKDKTITKEFKYYDKILLIQGNHIVSKQGKIGILLIIKDITVIRKLEKEQRQFISSVSHELRTPLTTIIGYTDLLKRRGIENKAMVYKSLDTINKEGHRLLRLVNDLLNLNKFENVEFNLIKTKMSISKLLKDVVNQMKIKSHKYEIDIDFNFLKLPEINGDYDRLKQVFINILDNSIKYSNPGDKIKVLLTHDSKNIEISIRDFGQGIPENKTNRLFDAFYRVEEDRSRELGGTGLGLSIVKQIIEKHNGTVRIESKINEGTRVIITLPIE